MELLVATGNRGKLRELENLLAGLPIRLLDLSHVPDPIEVEETGKTFSENSALKAIGYAQQSGLWTLADDSGLEVAALSGRPGVASARYGGVDMPYDEKISSLLKELDQTGDPDRTARFICVMAIADPTGRIAYEATGICKGTLAHQPRGTNGFGYDPIFIPDGFDFTFGELNDEIKRQISHRGQASREIIRYLLDFIGVSLDQSNIRL